MIKKEEIDALRHTEYNSDLTVMEMLNTLEALFRENEELKRTLKNERWNKLKENERNYP